MRENQKKKRGKNKVNNNQSMNWGVLRNKDFTGINF